MILYPVNIKLRGYRCLLIGGGNVAAEKIPSLLRSGAIVDVVAPTLNDEMSALLQQNSFTWKARKFRKSDVSKKYFLIMASTDNPVVNQEIYDRSIKAGKLVNCVDDPDRCNFYVPSITQCGDLQISVSTAGKAPLLSKSLRQFFESVFGQAMKPALEEIYQIRATIVKGENKKQERIRHELKPKIDSFLKNIHWS
ncbi:MAG: bifunctional precorrin-2 dehydrogenase/sirohydrochlorin ferrochelatase [Bacteroidales bacterium]